MPKNNLTRRSMAQETWTAQPPAATTGPQNLETGKGAPKPPPQDVLAMIRTASPQPRRKDERVREPVVSFRGIPLELRKQVENTAEEIGVPAGELARYLFEYGLLLYRSKQLDLAPRLSAGRLTLYPQSDSGWTPQPVAARPRRRKKGKTRTPENPVAYRGIPRELKEELVALAGELHVPQGELARKLLDHGLALYREGKLPITLYPVDSTRCTLYS